MGTPSAPAASLRSDDIRAAFSQAMSVMYRAEVPQYGTLLELVAEVNGETLGADPALRARLTASDDLDRINVERHGAIRVGTAGELGFIRRLFAVMGMVPVGYYDLSVAGVPVHSTAFRPVGETALANNPFRVFTSLLRLELIDDESLRREAEAILARRRIHSPEVLGLIERFELNGGLDEDEATRFVREAVRIFQWHSEATVDAETYRRLSAAHRLIADIVAFRGPHINHLTPRTLDIDEVQRRMPARGIAAKAVIEGPPPRACPILLRQTSFKALEEPILFGSGDGKVAGTHTARFGEIEQRGLALTRQGRALYDELLAAARRDGVSDDGAKSYDERLADAFATFPDDYDTLRLQGLGFFKYALSPAVRRDLPVDAATMPIEDLVRLGIVEAYPMIYEDFLPVSAAGIFQSNLGGDEQRLYEANTARAAFIAALGAPVADEFEIYEQAQQTSIAAVRAALRQRTPAPAS
ncbi:MAG: VOC family protein [Proteobacteria bacterium]|nr:VOC family protein [Pseudomonadota bacterium]